MRKTKPDAAGDVSVAPARLQLIPPDARTATEFAREIGVDVSTVIRWIKKGCKGPPVNGKRPIVHLRAFRRGGRYMVASADFAAFSAALLGQPTAPAETSAPTVRSPAQRRVAIDRANAEAAALGC